MGQQTLVIKTIENINFSAKHRFWNNTFGGWHEVAEAQVKKIASALAQHNGQEEGEALSHTWSRLGVLLQRGNAAMMANRIPSFPAAPIDGRE